VSKEPHGTGILDKYPYAAKSDVVGKIVCVLDARSEERGMQLILHPSRAVCRGEIHELAVTDDTRACPDSKVDRVAYVAFFAVEEGGIILVGDKVEINGTELGELAGFDNTHFPNHLNLLVRNDDPKTGPELGLRLEDPIVFSFSPLPSV
jgi:hypothetical protein